MSTPSAILVILLSAKHCAFKIHLDDDKNTRTHTHTNTYTHADRLSGKGDFVVYKGRRWAVCRSGRGLMHGACNRDQDGYRSTVWTNRRNQIYLTPDKRTATVFNEQPQVAVPTTIANLGRSNAQATPPGAIKKKAITNRTSWKKRTSARQTAVFS